MLMRLSTTVCVLAIFSVPSAYANMEYDGNISYGFSDNISNAVSDRDISRIVLLLPTSISANSGCRP